MNKEKKTVAIVPGSFDPITVGHLEIVRKAAERYDTVYLAVMINSEKNYMFTLEERAQIAEASIEGMKNVRVISSDGMLWELAKKLSACAIVKGYRNETDLAYEKAMAKFNEEHYPEAKTVLIPSEKELVCVSSTAVREEFKKSGELSKWIPKQSLAIIQKILAKH